ncbi:hypothetical protein GCM10025867_50220 (plasmid) [Frondihabitans sucicola]|uniref:Uncharacterized protein n=1 Tax=Frondihabitans sucicola TaxID=1268041 RepID=A0ABN6Y6H9_9MICO|nr:hypothetical protein [Frondihabitans sucicola]BDZ52781.1 hypothetical protein GCM10025867_50220 [Frondihabitans sucicola]
MTITDTATTTIRFITFEPSCGEHGGVGGFEWETADHARIDALYESMTTDPDLTDDTVALYEITVAAALTPAAIDDLIQIDYIDEWPSSAPIKVRPGEHAQKWVLASDGAEHDFTDPRRANDAYEALVDSATPQAAELIHVVYDRFEDDMVTRLIRTSAQPSVTFTVPADVAGAISESLEYVRQETPDDTEAEDPWGQSAADARSRRAASREGMRAMISEAQMLVSEATATAQVGTPTWIPSTPVTRIATLAELEAAPLFSIFAIADEAGTLSVHKDPTGHYFISGTFGPQTAEDVLTEADGGLYLVFTPPSQTVDWFNRR